VQCGVGHRLAEPADRPPGTDRDLAGAAIEPEVAVIERWKVNRVSSFSPGDVCARVERDHRKRGDEDGAQAAAIIHLSLRPTQRERQTEAPWCEVSTCKTKEPRPSRGAGDPR
jgi:hypothetical protein